MANFRRRSAKLFTAVGLDAAVQLAVRIPAELAYSTWEIDLIIERQGDELHIRPVPRRMDNVLAKLSKFLPDFMVDGRPNNEEGGREVLWNRSTCSKPTSAPN